MTVVITSVKLIVCIIIGIVIRKAKIVGEGFSKEMVKFVIGISLPCMIIKSFNVDFSVKDLLKCPVLIALALGGLLFSYLLGLLVTMKMKGSIRQMVRYALLFTNFTFIGLAIVSEIYGDMGVFNYVIFTFPIRVFFYGSAPFMLGAGNEAPAASLRREGSSGNTTSDAENNAGKKAARISAKEVLKKVFNAPVIAVFIGFIIYLVPFKLPGIVFDILGLVGNTATPLGLILCGTIIAEGKWNGIHKYPFVFWVSALRLLVIPAVFVGICMLIRISPDIAKTTMYYHAMPVASMLPSFLLRYNPEAEDARIAAGYLVTASTLFCVVTIPLWNFILDII